MGPVTEPVTMPTRCFVTGIVVTKPDHNRLVSDVYFQADHAYGNGLKGSFNTPDGSKYAVGDVVWITMSQ